LHATCLQQLHQHRTTPQRLPGTVRRQRPHCRTLRQQRRASNSDSCCCRCRCCTPCPAHTRTRTRAPRLRRPANWQQRPRAAAADAVGVPTRARACLVHAALALLVAANLKVLAALRARARVCVWGGGGRRQNRGRPGAATNTTGGVSGAAGGGTQAACAAGARRRACSRCHVKGQLVASATGHARNVGNTRSQHTPPAAASQSP
jgi:hypothetical protein